MIKYTLKCTNDHRFESWFASASAFDQLKNAGHVTCAICGERDVTKAIMAPQVRPARNASTPDRPERGALSQPATPAEQALQHMRKTIEENSDYVGDNFVTEARAMHNGERPERAIYGEARLADAKALIDDGIPVAPLPFAPKRKSN